MKNRIYIVNGPNLNKLGQRDNMLYGDKSFEDILRSLKNRFPALELIYFQNNCEGAIIDILQQSCNDVDTLGVVINPGAYSHYSYAIADAIGDLGWNKVPVIEVHMSNIAAREDFRQTTVTGARCRGVISGLGALGYELAIISLSKNGE